MMSRRYISSFWPESDGSTLTLDFTTGVLDSRLTFTRASTTATYINSSGYVTTAGTDVPRFDHDPTTLAPRGLLIEAAATNLLNWSASFATSGGTNNNWADTSITRTTGQADPANGTTAIRFTASAGNATVISSAAIGTSAARTFSVWLRRVTGTGNIQYTQNNGTNWTTQAITATWTRYTFTHTVDHRVGIRIVTSGDAIEMWGAQLETGSGASSYIPTGASTATRNPDNCELLNLTTMGFNASAGTIYVDTGTRIGTGGRSYSFMPTSGINDQIFEGNGFLLNVYSSGTFVAQIGTGTASAAKIAAAYAVNDYAVSVNGGAPSTDTAGALPTTIAKLTIGARDSSSVTQMNGCIRVFKYWPTRLPNAQLQSLTT
jgi:hypothetical protein